MDPYNLTRSAASVDEKIGGTRDEKRANNRSRRYGTRDWPVFHHLSRCTGLLKDVRSDRWSHFQATRLAGKEEVVSRLGRDSYDLHDIYIYIYIYIYTRSCLPNVRLDRPRSR